MALIVRALAQKVGDMGETQAEYDARWRATWGRDKWRPRDDAARERIARIWVRGQRQEGTNQT